MEIKFNEVCFSYEKVNYMKKEVLNNINLQLMEGKINGIIGPSGSGKTTMAEIMVSLLLPNSGNVKIGNFVINNKKNNLDKIHFEIGLLFQFPEDQIFNTTVKEELEYSLKIFNYKTKKLDKQVNDALIMVGLDESYLEKNPFKLSNSEKRKIALASILIINPSIIILDEPTIGLDSDSKNNLIKLLRTLKNRYNKTIIIITHDTDMLHKIVDYICVLYDKKIVLSGDKYEVFKQVKLLNKYGIKVPKVIEFSDKVLNKKNIKIGYRDEINDLIKDIYRYVK